MRDLQKERLRCVNSGSYHTDNVYMTDVQEGTGLKLKFGPSNKIMTHVTEHYSVTCAVTKVKNFYSKC